MKSSRHLGRVAVLQTLFSLEQHGGAPDETLTYVAQEFEGKLNDISFAAELLHGIEAARSEIHKFIEQYAPQWPLAKVAPIDRVILEIGIFEMLHSKDVPAIVAIDEAIELAKQFGNENSPKFINGVLNAILNSPRFTGKATRSRKENTSKSKKS